MRRTPILILAIWALTLTGCVSARDTNAVAQAQAEALDHLAVESALTNAALLHMTSAVAAIRVERAASDAEASIIADLLTSRGGADHAALDALLAQATPPSNPLAAQVREGRMTAGDAHDWLDTYAAAWSATDASTTRRRLLESIHAVQYTRNEGAAITAQLRERAESNARLFADARASSRALLGAAASDPTLDALATATAETWADLLLEHIDDPDQRAAAERLLRAVTDWSDFTTTDGDNQ